MQHLWHMKINLRYITFPITLTKPRTFPFRTKSSLMHSSKARIRLGYCFCVYQLSLIFQSRVSWKRKVHAFTFLRLCHNWKKKSVIFNDSQRFSTLKLFCGISIFFRLKITQVKKKKKTRSERFLVSLKFKVIYFLNIYFEITFLWNRKRV